MSNLRCMERQGAQWSSDDLLNANAMTGEDARRPRITKAGVWAAVAFFPPVA